MPKYVYRCGHCLKHFEVVHGMTDNQHRCIHCGTRDPQRVPQMPFVKTEDSSEGSKVGDETKAAIEENREILKKAKKKARKNNYAKVVKKGSKNDN
tara:strand:- start:1493 stop:1780 length:288 start_codon:yes stop_codon:yes gene_type:complete